MLSSEILTGPCKVPKAITDTGPILHLHEINHLNALESFEELQMTPLVVEELSRFGLEPKLLEAAGPKVAVFPPESDTWQSLLQDGGPVIQPADAQILVLARQTHFGLPVLTDDLSLRQRVESEGGTAVGSLGILLRAYRIGALTRQRLENAVERLLKESTLHLSVTFRGYIRRLLQELE